MKIMLWLGVLTTGGTLLKGCGFKKAENIPNEHVVPLSSGKIKMAELSSSLGVGVEVEEG